MSKQKFVLSRKAFDSLKEAEEKATGYMNGGQLEQGTKCFLVTKRYKPVIKFKEIK
jgi:hypothetical protein